MVPFMNDEINAYEKKRGEYFDYVVARHAWEQTKIGRAPKKVKEPKHPLSLKVHNVKVNSHTFVGAMNNGYLPFITDLFPDYYTDPQRHTLHYFDLLLDGAKPHTAAYTRKEMAKLGLTTVSD